MPTAHPQRASAIRRFLDNQASSGLVLMAAALIALCIANSSAREGYEALLHAYAGPLSIGHWINDGLMAVFFLLVGLEVKRELLDGQLSTWPRRALPGIAALGGMAAPALVYLAFNRGAGVVGWAIPAATDIAFALGVMSLLGSRVPQSLRIFLAALAIMDDLGAVLIIALFYTAQISLAALAGAAIVTGVLIAMNRMGVRRLPLYLLLGAVLWVFVLQSGIHATLAGIVLALTIPMDLTRGATDADAQSPLHRLESALHIPVGFLILPVFGLANAGVPVLDLPSGALVAPVTLGAALGLLIGKVVGVYGFSLIAIRIGMAELPIHSGWRHMFGVALLCGIGFTMSIFITLLAFPNDLMLQAEAKTGVLMGSFAAGLCGYAWLRWIAGPPVRVGASTRSA